MQTYNAKTDFGAVGNGTADDTQALQAALTAAQSSVGNILIIPPGNYKISDTLTINSPTTILNLTIEGAGATLKASTGMDGKYILWIEPSDSNQYGCQQITIRDLSIDGVYMAKGLFNKAAQGMLLDNVKIWCCRVGLGLSDFYYGEVSGGPSIRECLVGVETVASSDTKYGEINTVKLDNIRINFGSPENRKKFYPQQEGESPEDWTARLAAVNTYGVLLGTACNALKLEGLSIERYSYGIGGFKQLVTPGVGTESSILYIGNCYFEEIYKASIALAMIKPGDPLTLSDPFTDVGENRSLISPRVNIIGCQFFCPNANAQAGKIILGYGIQSIFRNNFSTEPNAKLSLISKTFTRHILETDLLPGKISDETGNPYTRQINHVDTKDFYTNPYKYRNYGIVDRDPTHGMVSTVGDSRGVNATMSDQRMSFAKNIYSITSSTLTFDSYKDAPAGPVLKDSANNFHMILVENGQLKLRQVINRRRIAAPLDWKTAKELYRNAGIAEGTVTGCIDLDAEVVKSGGKWWHKGYEDARLAIGTSGDIIASPASGGSWHCWNISINQSWCVSGGVWYLGKDWYGKDFVNKAGASLQNSAYGTLAERNAISGNNLTEGHVFYVTEQDIYYSYSEAGGQWNAYVPSWENMRVTAVSPVNGKTGVSANTKIVLTFTNTVPSSETPPPEIELLDGSGTAVAYVFSRMINTATLTPASSLPAGTYTVKVAAGYKDNGTGQEQTATMFAFSSTFTV